MSLDSLRLPLMSELISAFHGVACVEKAQQRTATTEGKKKFHFTSPSPAYLFRSALFRHSSGHWCRRHRRHSHCRRSCEHRRAWRRLSGGGIRVHLLLALDHHRLILALLRVVLVRATHRRPAVLHGARRRPCSCAGETGSRSSRAQTPPGSLQLQRQRRRRRQDSPCHTAASSATAGIGAGVAEPPAVAAAVAAVVVAVVAVVVEVIAATPVAAAQARSDRWAEATAEPAPSGRPA
jgi:hypothetical protein